jgi:phospholipid/cholesterol/gamma-HCH transport system substrate-binding protein
MQAKLEQTLVGLFVVVAAIVLVATVLAMNGVSGGNTKTFHAYFPFAGGLEPGTTVRYSGGPKIGRVIGLKIDPQDAARFDVTFSVHTDVPVKTDSHVKIMSMNPLGDNHLEIMPGTPQSAAAPDGALLPSEVYVDFNALTAQINQIAPKAQLLLVTLNDRATELKETISRVNDLLTPQNRANLSATLASARGMLEENRATIKTTLSNVNAATVKLQPLLDDFKKTSDEANKTLDHVDSMLGENRADVRQAVSDLRRTLANTTELTERINQTLDVNSENIDQILDTLQHVMENLKEFTETIKTQPSTIIRANNPREHKPGDKK